MRKKVEEWQYKAYRQAWNDAGQGKIKTDWPIDLTIELCSVCDSSCVFCPITENRKPKDNLFDSGYISYDLYKKIIDEASGAVFSIKNQYRGESTLHPFFNEFMGYLSQKNFIETLINTNGNYKEEKREGLYLLDKIIFSIDSVFIKTYESIRVNLKYSKLMENFWHAYNFYKKNGYPNIKINMTVTSLNKDEIDLFHKIFPKDIEVRQAPVFNRTQNAKDYNLYNMKIIGRRPCQYPQQRFIILFNGDVLPCCSPWTRKESESLTLGNINQNSIYNIWHSDKTTKLKEDTLKANYEPYFACKTCKSYASYNVVDQDRLWGLY